MKWFKRKKKEPKIYGHCNTCGIAIYVNDSLEKTQIHMLHHQIIVAEDNHS